MKTVLNDHIKHANEPSGQAVVVGGGIAGLSAARVLAQYYKEVTVLERDRLPEDASFRAGIPQAHHAHTLLPYGQMLLERLFPGLVDQLTAAGAIAIDDETETVYADEGIWQKPERRISRSTVSFSRPLLEQALYRRMGDFPQVKILQGYEVTGLATDDLDRKVTGVTVRTRGAADGSSVKQLLIQNIPADLVVDASGRNSKAPQWLADLGYTPPEEWQIDAHTGYASRIYRRPANAQESWKKLYVGPSPPDGLRGGVIVPLEGERWHVTLIGIAGDYPPTDEKGFTEFARSLPDPTLSEAIGKAEPLGRISGFRRNENRVRRFENLPRYLEGLLVLGDAVYTMNPIYSLGMTAALLSSQVLDQVLKSQKGKPGSAELASGFQKKLAVRMNALWQQAVHSDWGWPATEIKDNSEELAAPPAHRRQPLPA